jgi:hypothetical protein
LGDIGNSLANAARSVSAAKLSRAATRSYQDYKHSQDRTFPLNVAEANRRIFGAPENKKSFWPKRAALKKIGVQVMSAHPQEPKGNFPIRSFVPAKYSKNPFKFADEYLGDKIEKKFKQARIRRALPSLEEHKALLKLKLDKDKAVALNKLLKKRDFNAWYSTSLDPWNQTQLRNNNFYSMSNKDIEDMRHIRPNDDAVSDAVLNKDNILRRRQSRVDLQRRIMAEIQAQKPYQAKWHKIKIAREGYEPQMAKDYHT